MVPTYSIIRMFSLKAMHYDSVASQTKTESNVSTDEFGEGRFDSQHRFAKTASRPAHSSALHQPVQARRSTDLRTTDALLTDARTKTQKQMTAFEGVVPIFDFKDVI